MRRIPDIASFWGFVLFIIFSTAVVSVAFGSAPAKENSLTSVFITTTYQRPGEYVYGTLNNFLVGYTTFISSIGDTVVRASPAGSTPASAVGRFAILASQDILALETNMIVEYVEVARAVPHAIADSVNTLGSVTLGVTAAAVGLVPPLFSYHH